MINQSPQPRRSPAPKPRLRALTPLPMRRYPQRVWLDRIGSLVVMALLVGFVILILWTLLGGL